MSSMHVGSFDAWVTIEGDVAQVYDSRVDEGRSISQGWIASTAGKVRADGASCAEVD